MILVFLRDTMSSFFRDGKHFFLFLFFFFFFFSLHLHHYFPFRLTSFFPNSSLFPLSFSFTLAQTILKLKSMISPSSITTSLDSTSMQ